MLARAKDYYVRQLQVHRPSKRERVLLGALEQVDTIEELAALSTLPTNHRRPWEAPHVLWTYQDDLSLVVLLFPLTLPGLYVLTGGLGWSGKWYTMPWKVVTRFDMKRRRHLVWDPQSPKLRYKFKFRCRVNQPYFYVYLTAQGGYVRRLRITRTLRAPVHSLRLPRPPVVYRRLARVVRGELSRRLTAWLTIRGVKWTLQADIYYTPLEDHTLVCQHVWKNSVLQPRASAQLRVESVVSVMSGLSGRNMFYPREVQVTLNDKVFFWVAVYPKAGVYMPNGSLDWFGPVHLVGAGQGTGFVWAHQFAPDQDIIHTTLRLANFEYNSEEWKLFKPL